MEEQEKQPDSLDMAALVAYYRQEAEKLEASAAQKLREHDILSGMAQQTRKLIAFHTNADS